MKSDLRAAFARERPFILTTLLLFIAWLGWVNFWSPDRFYRFDRVHVSDARLGDPVLMQVDRTIVREFRGSYVAKVVRLPAKTSVCAGGANVPYEPDAALPEPLTLAWWTYGAAPDCMSALTPDLYRLRTCIEIRPDVPLVGDMQACAVSNDFRVTP